MEKSEGLAVEAYRGFHCCSSVTQEEAGCTHRRGITENMRGLCFLPQAVIIPSKHTHKRVFGVKVQRSAVKGGKNKTM